MPVVALDCEMVLSINENILARVSIVNEQDYVLLDEYVKPTDHVTDYRSSITGITKEKLDNGKSFHDVQSRVLNLISSGVVVGHSLHSDFKVLGLNHPESKRRDLAKYGPYMKNGQPQSLKILAEKYLGMHIQNGVHDSVEDARAAMKLYNLVANEWEKQY